tara:strand:- start:18129 stop:18809 length:681 start_codon:yes stop_codon:yes gene_type:complete
MFSSKIVFTVLLAVLTVPANATLITIDFKGAVSFLEPGLESSFNLGDEITGRYTYDTLDSVDTLPENSSLARYYAVRDFDLMIGGHFWKSTTKGYIQVRDVSPIYTEEAYSVVQRAFSPSQGELQNIWLSTLFSGSQLGVNELSGITLPEHIPFNTSDYSYMMRFGSFGNSLQLNGLINSIDIARKVNVASPSSLLLLGLGVLIILIRSIRKIKRNSTFRASPNNN